MSIEPEQLSIPMADGTSVSAHLYAAPKEKRSRVTVILGHGAGAGQLHPFMRFFASGLAERGVDAMTFNFQYMEQGRKAPDPKAKLESCYLSVIEAALKNKQLKANRLVIGGKSMGGRIASQVAAALAQGILIRAEPMPTGSGLMHKAQATPIINGLVFLGYPLHPPGKPDQLRDAHLPQIKSPMLFMQGSRDAFGSAEEISATIKKHRLPATLHVVEGGDHSLKVSGGARLSQEQTYGPVIDEIARWLKAKL